MATADLASPASRRPRTKAPQERPLVPLSTRRAAGSAR
jgi:hypothetical protein